LSTKRGYQTPWGLVRIRAHFARVELGPALAASEPVLPEIPAPPPPSRPDGVIEVVLPSGFVKCVRSVGLALPDDISVIGFDGIEFAEFVEPTLTTFRQPRRELGYRGASLLVSAMRGEATDQTNVRQRLSVPLLERGSTGPAPRSRRH